MKIKILDDQVHEFRILACFPFTSDSKRMGILVRHEKS